MRQCHTGCRQPAHDGGTDCGSGTFFVDLMDALSTLSKEDIRKRINLEEISHAVPVNAIGGPNKDNIHILAGIPVAGICVVSTIMKGEEPEQAAPCLLPSPPISVQRHSHHLLCSDPGGHRPDLQSEQEEDRPDVRRNGRPP